jgi:hypothetical protein
MGSFGCSAVGFGGRKASSLTPFSPREGQISWKLEVDDFVPIKESPNKDKGIFETKREAPRSSSHFDGQICSAGCSVNN